MSIFNNKFITICGTTAVVLALAGGCAKESTVSLNGDNKMYLDAWLSVHHPDVSPTGLGIYIIDDQPGTGAAVADGDLYYFIRYTGRDLDGKIGSTSEEKVAQQVGNAVIHAVLIDGTVKMICDRDDGAGRQTIRRGQYAARSSRGRD